MNTAIGIGIGIPFSRRRGVAWGYTDAQIQAFIDDGYIPVATHQDLNAVRTAYEGGSKRNFAVGTKWETGEINTTGLAGSYIQVADIDLYDECRTGGAYDNAGAGWSPISVFTGTYNGGGHIINGLYQNRSEGGVFRGLGATTSIIRKLAVINAYIIASGQSNGIITSHGYNIDGCFSSGIIIGTQATDCRAAGLIGQGTGSGVYQVINCYSAASVLGTTYLGGFAGRTFLNSLLKNNFSIGSVSGDSFVGGFLGHNNSTNNPVNNYYNTETSGQSDTGKGTPKTTAQMLSGTPSVDIYTDWDNEIDPVTGKPVWIFKAGRYPILSIFGKLAANIPAPINLDTAIDGSDIVLTWDDHPDAPAPKGYNAYVSIDNGAWTQINPALLTSRTFTYTPAGAGAYNFFVKAVYNIRNFDQSTGNSVTTIETIA